VRKFYIEHKLTNITNLFILGKSIYIKQ